MAYERALLAIADPTRRAVFESLRDRPLAVVEIAAGLPVSRPAVSQHLKILKEAGLVSDEPSGNRRVYRIEPRGLAELHDYLQRFWHDALDAYEKAAKNKVERRQA